jgi:hypothetical protein
MVFLLCSEVTEIVFCTKILSFIQAYPLTRSDLTALNNVYYYDYYILQLSFHPVVVVLTPVQAVVTLWQ